jgi:hypothetical protein
MGRWARSLVLVAALGCRTTDLVDNDGDGWFSRSDCNDSNPLIHPGVAEVPADGIDNDCDPNTRDDDLDGDGFLPPFDCEPENPFVPRSFETPYDGLDNDCNPATPDDDLDRDGFALDADCDDADPARNPGQAEVPYDGVDNDCDETTPDDDLDGDGLTGAEDCDDGDSAVDTAPLWYADCDGDGFAADPDADHALPAGVASCETPLTPSCPDGTGGTWTLREPVHPPDSIANTTTDCNDLEPNAFPGQPDHFAYAGGPFAIPYDFDCDGANEFEYTTFVCLPVPASQACSVTPGYVAFQPRCGEDATIVADCAYEPVSGACTPTDVTADVVRCQ